MKILLLDNYDSFTYNLLHVVKELGIKDVEIFRNDQIALSEIERFDKIILSPGPGSYHQRRYFVSASGARNTRRTLPFMGSKPQRFSGVSGNYSRKPGRANHGIAPSDVRCTWHSIPSRIGVDTTGQSYHSELFKCINV